MFPFKDSIFVKISFKLGDNRLMQKNGRAKTVKSASNKQ